MLLGGAWLASRPLFAKNQIFGYYVSEIGKEKMHEERLLVAGCGSGMEVLYGHVVGIRTILAYDSDTADYTNATKLYKEKYACEVAEDLMQDLPEPAAFEHMFCSNPVKIQSGMKDIDLFPQEGTTIAHFMINLPYNEVMIIFKALVYSARCTSVKYITIEASKQSGGESTTTLIEKVVPEEARVYEEKAAVLEGGKSSISFYIIKMDESCRRLLKSNIEKVEKGDVYAVNRRLDVTVSGGFEGPAA